MAQWVLRYFLPIHLPWIEHIREDLNALKSAASRKARFDSLFCKTYMPYFLKNFTTSKPQAIAVFQTDCEEQD
jgi:hypothetical protein